MGYNKDEYIMTNYSISSDVLITESPDELSEPRDFFSNHFDKIEEIGSRNHICERKFAPWVLIRWIREETGLDLYWWYFFENLLIDKSINCSPGAYTQVRIATYNSNYSNKHHYKEYYWAEQIRHAVDKFPNDNDEVIDEIYKTIDWLTNIYPYMLGEVKQNDNKSKYDYENYKVHLKCGIIADINKSDFVSDAFELIKSPKNNEICGNSTVNVSKEWSNLNIVNNHKKHGEDSQNPKHWWKILTEKSDKHKVKIKLSKNNLITKCLDKILSEDIYANDSLELPEDFEYIYCKADMYINETDNKYHLCLAPATRDGHFAYEKYTDKLNEHIKQFKTLPMINVPLTIDIKAYNPDYGNRWKVFLNAIGLNEADCKEYGFDKSKYDKNGHLLKFNTTSNKEKILNDENLIEVENVSRLFNTAIWLNEQEISSNCKKAARQMGPKHKETREKADMKSDQSVKFKQLVKNISIFFSEHERDVKDNEIINYLLCLHYGCLVTLAGLPGTGKTSSIEILADAICNNKKRFLKIPVQKGWTTHQDFIGYYNPLAKSKADDKFAKIIPANHDVFNTFKELHKNDKNNDLFIICLDEANLSCPEHYLTPIMEHCDYPNDPLDIPLGGDVSLNFPSYMRFVATINNDHTTEELSPRYLDRSWVIYFEAPEKCIFNRKANDSILINPLNIDYGQMNKWLNHDPINDNWDDWYETNIDGLKKLIALCYLFGYPISPRSQIMCNKYIYAACKVMQRDESLKHEPLDYAFSQKILPTLASSEKTIKLLLTAIDDKEEDKEFYKKNKKEIKDCIDTLNFSIDGDNQFNRDNIEDLLNAIKELDIPKTKKHIKRMLTNGEQFGHYSFFN